MAIIDSMERFGDRISHIKQLAKEADVIGLIHEATFQDDPDVRWSAVRALGKVRSPEAIEALIDLLSDENEEIRIAAARSLADIGDRGAVPVLLQMLDGETNLAKAWIADSLGRLADAEAVDALVSLLGEDDVSVRIPAAKALGCIGDPRVLSILEKAKTQARWRERREMAKAIQSLKKRASRVTG